MSDERGEEFDTETAGLFVVAVQGTGKTVAVEVKPGEIVVMRVYRDGSYSITKTEGP